MKRLYRRAVRALLVIMVCRGQALVATVPPSFSEPNSSTNHYVYIHYTATTPFTHNRVSRFVANGNVAVAGSETAILAEEAVPTAAAGRTNVALASAGAMAVGSSTVNSGFPVSAAIDGDRKGVGWGAGGGWNDGTPSVFPDWLEVDFNGTYTIDEIDVYERMADDRVSSCVDQSHPDPRDECLGRLQPDCGSRSV